MCCVYNNTMYMNGYMNWKILNYISQRRHLSTRWGYLRVKKPLMHRWSKKKETFYIPFICHLFVVYYILVHWVRVVWCTHCTVRSSTVQYGDKTGKWTHLTILYTSQLYKTYIVYIHINNMYNYNYVQIHIKRFNRVYTILGNIAYDER